MNDIEASQFEKKIRILEQKLKRKAEEQKLLEERIHKQSALAIEIEKQRSEIQSLSEEKLRLMQKFSEQQRKALEIEIENAAIVQKTLLPEKVEFEHIKIAPYYRVSAQAGGDWYGYWECPRSNTFFCFIADVTGHGIASSMVTGVCTGSIHCKILSAFDREHFSKVELQSLLLEVAQTLNIVINCTGKRVGRLLTLLGIAIDCATGEGYMLNAGHCFPLIRQKQNESYIVKNLMIAGPRIGYARDSKFSIKEFKLQKGDELFLYTDGLIENGGMPDDEPSGIINIKQLKAIFQKEETITAKRASIESLINSCWEEKSVIDDTTFLFLKYE
jgi:serine phosphatase RsbU (regulator of sigma subunit)